MKIGAWLRHAIFGVPPSERFCRNCLHYSEKELEDRLHTEHDLVAAHLQSGNWHPKGKKHASGAMGWCNVQEVATESKGISCEFWVEMDEKEARKQRDQKRDEAEEAKK